LLFVVAEAIGPTVAAADAGGGIAAEVTTRVPKELGLETVDGDCRASRRSTATAGSRNDRGSRAYLADDEDPEPFVRFVGRARRDPGSVRAE
jgi:hypothetical protein